MSEKLERLGVAVRALQDRALSERESASSEERGNSVRGALARRRQGKHWSRPLTLAAASFAVIASALIAALLVARAPASLGVLSAGRSIDIGAWLESEREALPLDFSDGTSLVLSAPSRARLLRIDEHGAELTLERGTVRAAVAKRAGARWVVSAGPFQVLVTGTRFEASWDPERELLEVTMQEGSVRVSGRCIQQKSLLAGESASFQCEKPVTQEAPRPPEAPRAASAATAPRAPPVPALRAGTAPEPSAAPAAEWSALSREARFKEALAAAEAEGFSALCSSASAERLLELGNVARLAGSPARASEAFLALRQRFAGSGAAATAGFHLGRIAFDGSHDYASSRRWFAAYLAEQPGGRFAEEALGRLMESEHRAGDRAAAEASSARYLSQFPTGAHAALAQSLSRK
ncbi:MAG: FecR domain-containing protein [Myxococcales bacterium]|nr:FecR domain-containing protein [Myxococcales bacterium]